jgi:hypothetical protein
MLWSLLVNGVHHSEIESQTRPLPREFNVQIRTAVQYEVMPMQTDKPSRIEDLSGKEFFGWRVIAFSSRISRGDRNTDYWSVCCIECGLAREFIASKIKRGDTARCNHVAPKAIKDLEPPHFMPILGFPGYIAGDDGSVWSCHIRGGLGGLSDKWLSMPFTLDKDGYPTVCVRLNTKPFKKRVSHLILETFCGPRPDGQECCHFPDPNPLNNRIENIRWGTHKENINDKISHNSGAKGVGHGMAVFSEDAVMEIRRLRRAGASYREIAIQFNTSESYACEIVKGHAWGHLPI